MHEPNAGLPTDLGWLISSQHEPPDLLWAHLSIRATCCAFHCWPSPNKNLSVLALRIFVWRWSVRCADRLSSSLFGFRCWRIGQQVNWLMQAIGATPFLMPGSRMPWTWLFHGAVVRSLLECGFACGRWGKDTLLWLGSHQPIVKGTLPPIILAFACFLFFLIWESANVQPFDVAKDAVLCGELHRSIF